MPKDPVRFRQSSDFRKYTCGPIALLAVGILAAAATPIPRPIPAPDQDRFFLDLGEGSARPALDSDALYRSVRTGLAGAAPTSTVKIDYPMPRTLFPPDMVAPTVLFHDSIPASRFWLVVVSAAGEKGRVLILTDGRREKREADPRCGTHADEHQESEYQASAKGWTAAPVLWEEFSRLPERDITIAVYGVPDPAETKPGTKASLLSQGSVLVRVSRDPVGAPIVYRDVPLMPTTNDQGVIKPLAEGALPLVEWRLRDLAEPSSRVLLKNLPTCTNCHSFSNDGKYLGLDMDGPSGDKGSYAFARVEPRMVVTNEQVFTWNALDPTHQTFGMFSRVSPDGTYVVSTVRESLFVTNYMDFRFLQTFYPTRGILAFYDRRTGKMAVLPGADDSRYVHTNAVWTPDGKRIVFLRAAATDNTPRGPRPLKANDPNEIQIRYDLCTIPFNEGRGGEAVPLPGASNNGKSNSFPKVSPDGRWIVWVQAGNGLLMRPDSELYIMRLDGGRPRRMDCNLPLMNSWHSWSPNGRWLVFSSKANTPYTEMFLTHIDENGNDSPAVLIPGSTAVNRAVNLPEFAAIAPGDLLSIDAPAVDYRRHVDKGLELIAAKNFPEAFVELRTAEDMKPDYPEMLAALGYYYRETGDVPKAIQYFEKTISIDPRNWAARNLYGMTLFRQKKYDEALKHLQAAVAIYPINSMSLAMSLGNIGAVEYALGDRLKAKDYFEKSVAANPDYPEAQSSLAALLNREGNYAAAAAHFEKYLELVPGDVEAMTNLAWIYATAPRDDLRNGRRAMELAANGERLSKVPTARTYDVLAAACAEAGEFGPAVAAAEKAIQMTGPQNSQIDARRRLLELYKSGRPYHRQNP